MRATLKRELGQGHERMSSGIAGAVPVSLGRTTNIDTILQAADEIQDEDPNVARICKFFFFLRIEIFHFGQFDFFRLLILKLFMEDCAMLNWNC